MYRVAPPQEARRYATLDGLRGAAALLVALFHFQTLMGTHAVRGYLAVDLFFGISGFVLSAAYVERFKNGLDPSTFLSLRIARFYPLYACGSLMGFVAVASAIVPSTFGPREYISAGLLGLLMSPNPTSYQLFPFNDPAWSLFLELLINLMLACWLWKRRSSDLAFLAAAALVTMLAVAHSSASLNLGSDWPSLAGGGGRALFSFIVGMLIFRAIGHRPPRASSGAILLPLVVLLFALPPIGSGALWDLAFVILISPLVLVAATMTEAPPWARPGMHWLGGFSYALYAIHWPLARLLGALLKPLPSTVATAVYLATAVLLANLLHAYVDQPLQGYFKRRRQDRRSTAQGSTSLQTMTWDETTTTNANIQPIAIGSSTSMSR